MVGEPPLKGIKVLEFAGLAPGPFAGLLLADSGASVLRIDRPSASAPPTIDFLARRKTSLAINLKDPAGQSLARALALAADVLIDPFRPGVLERLGLGPDVLLAANPRLIYARITGFRRDGRYADMAGHDINYLAVSGVLGLLGRAGERPYAPSNIVADFAGGGAPLFQGILLALIARQSSGKGQVVEANMVDGSSYLASFPRFNIDNHLGNQPRGENVLDGGCPWYDTYETSDGRYMSVGAMEPQFFAAFVKRLGLGEDETQRLIAAQHDRSGWAAMRRLFADTLRSRTRDEWERVFDASDACCVPVFTYAELRAGRHSGREGDQRPFVALRDTPLYGDVHDGYTGTLLEAGDGGERTVSDWCGWRVGKEMEIRDGGMVLKKESRL